MNVSPAMWLQHILTFKVDRNSRQYSSLIAFGLDMVTAASELLKLTLPIEQYVENTCIIHVLLIMVQLLNHMNPRNPRNCNCIVDHESLGISACHHRENP